MNKYKSVTTQVEVTAVQFPLTGLAVGCQFQLPSGSYEIKADANGLPVIYILSEIGGYVAVNQGDWVVTVNGMNDERCSPYLFNSLFTLES